MFAGAHWNQEEPVAALGTASLTEVPVVIARPPSWITWLPVTICLVLNIIGFGLVAVRWAQAVGGEGARPDDLASPVPEEALAFVSVQLLSAVLLVLAGRISHQEREVVVLTTGVVVMLAIFQWGGLLGSAGSDEPAVSMSIALLIGLITAVAAALAVWSAIRVPSHPGPPVIDLGAAPSAIGPWSDHTRVTRLLTYGPALALIPLTAMLLWALASVGHAVALLIALALVAMVAVQLAARCLVLVDARGVTARGLGVFTWIRIPVASIAGAHPVFDINPVGDFGGWGLRTGFDGTRALITDAGAGVRIEQRTGPAVVITVEYPSEAAAAINALVWHRDSASGTEHS